MTVSSPYITLKDGFSPFKYIKMTFMLLRAYAINLFSILESMVAFYTSSVGTRLCS